MRYFVQAVKERDLTAAKHYLGESLNALTHYGSFQAEFGYNK